jgi:hypothetical protein
MPVPHLVCAQALSLPPPRPTKPIHVGDSERSNTADSETAGTQAGTRAKANGKLGHRYPPSPHCHWQPEGPRQRASLKSGLSLRVFSWLCGGLLVLCGLTLTQARTHAQLVPQQQRDALVALYNATNGPGWVYSNGWLQGDPCYYPGWYGVQLCGGVANDIVYVTVRHSKIANRLGLQPRAIMPA